MARLHGSDLRLETGIEGILEEEVPKHLVCQFVLGGVETKPVGLKFQQGFAKTFSKTHLVLGPGYLFEVLAHA